MKAIVFPIVVGLIYVFSVAAYAVPIGALSFDTFISGPGGVNTLSLNNFTEAFALPPDFPVLDALTLRTSTLTLAGSTPQTIPLGDIGPGPWLDPGGNPPVVVQFPDTADFTLATFTAFLSQTSFLLADDSMFVAGSPFVSATLRPGSGSFLVPGDVVILDVAAQAVPEPGTLWLLGSAVVGLWLWQRRRAIAVLPARQSTGAPSCSPGADALPMRRQRQAPGFMLLLVCVGIAVPLVAQAAVTLSSSASPAAGQPGVTMLQVTGTNFPPGMLTPATVSVTLAPATAGSGPTVSTSASAVTTLVGSTRRVTFQVPATAVVAAPTAYRVALAGTTSTGATFMSSNTATVTLNPPAGISAVQPNSAQGGQTVDVTLTGTFTNFVQGATQASFGPGSAVGGGPEGGFGPVRVSSPTSAVAHVVLNAAAPAGLRTVTVKTGVQHAPLADAFTVTQLPAALALSNLIAPATVMFGGMASVTFDYTSPAADIVTVETTRTNALGTTTVSVPASLLSIAGTQGHVALSLQAGDLAFGENTFTLQLEDDVGRVSNQGTFVLQVVGDASGGTAPALSDFVVRTTPWTRPSGPQDRLRPLFSFVYSDADEDIERIRIRVVPPTGGSATTEGSAVSRGIVGMNGMRTGPLVTFQATDPLGLYRLELTLIDRNGNVSNTAIATVELVAAGGAAALAITDFVPQQGAAGTPVTLMGSGFDVSTPEHNQVTLAEVPVEVTGVTATTLTVIVPPHAGTGKFVVRHQHGAALSAGLFTVPTAVTVSPDLPEVVVTGTQVFTATVVSSFFTEVTWSVNGLSGGHPTVGTITPTGRYTAPADIPPAGVVTVTATLVSNPTVVGQTRVTLLPPPSTPGSATVLASVGGTVHSVDGRARVDIPAGALAATTDITVTVLRGAALPPALPGRRIAGAADFTPSGLAFTSPVTITLPLSRFHPPGTQLPLRFFDPGSMTYQDEGLATVTDNGEQATAAVLHFSTHVIDDPDDVQIACQLPPVTITGLTPGAGQQFLEGLKVPTLLTGTGLSTDLVPRIFRNGAESPDIIPGTLYVLGNQAGLVLDIQPIPDLGEGETRIYTLRLERPTDGSCPSTFADIDVVVAGLYEYIVPAGETWDINFPFFAMYSMVDIAGTVNVRSDIFSLEVTGPVRVTGTINARGANGPDAPGQLCGGVDPAGQCGRIAVNPGVGGFGRHDNGCFLGLGSDGFDCAEPENFGHNASTCIGEPLECINDAHIPRGLGGRPGVNFGGLDGLIALVTNLVTCVGSAGIACVQAVGNVIEIVDSTANLIDNGGNGKRGFGAVSGSGGGGGGGGGRISLIVYQISGGGGGAGGEPGRGIRLVTAGEMSLWGTIAADGGQGGNGSGIGQAGIPIPFGLIRLGLESGFGGGGGGGGSGGSVSLLVGGAMHRGPGAMVSAAGGEGGMGGVTVVDDTNSPLPHRFTFRSGLGTDGARGSVGLLGGPRFGPTLAENMVTNRSLLAIHFPDRDRGPVTIRIEDETGQRHRDAIATFSDATGMYTANLVFFQGFNRIVAGHDWLDRWVLVLALDRDADGLADVDEIALGTDPYQPDTDGDGLNDGHELLLAADPLHADTDGDGLTDGSEVNVYRTDPRQPDTSGDGLWDGVEVVVALALGLHPQDPRAHPRCLFHKSTASACALASFPRTRESRRRAHGDWMPACASMTFHWCRTYEMDI